jgi:hypothetical protein
MERILDVGCDHSLKEFHLLFNHLIKNLANPSKIIESCIFTKSIYRYGVSDLCSFSFFTFKN